MHNELLKIGPFTVYGYGLMIAIGIFSAYCLAECCLGKPHRVDACQESECPLYAFRYGTDPYQVEPSRSPDASRKHR